MRKLLKEGDGSVVFLDFFCLFCFCFVFRRAVFFFFIRPFRICLFASSFFKCALFLLSLPVSICVLLFCKKKKKKKKRSSFFFLLGNSFLSSKLFIVRREKELDEIGGWALRSSSLLTPRRPERGALSHYERHASLQRQGDCCWRKWHRGESRRCHRRRRQSCDAFDKQEWCSGRSLFFHCASLVPKKRRRLPLGKWPREMVLSSTERRAGQREKRTEKETNDASLFFAAS